MFGKMKRLFVIKTRLEAFLIIFALALGAMTRGAHYTVEYPGWGGYLLFTATAGAVFLGGAKILDALRYEREAKAAAERDPAAASGRLKKSRRRWGFLLLATPGAPESASVARWVQPRFSFVNSGR